MARVLGLAAAVKVDDDDSGSVFTTVTLILDIPTPPGRKRVRVPGTALSDTLEIEGAGIETVSDYVFQYYRDVGATPETTLVTLFDAKTEVLWQLVHSDGGVEQFNGIIMDLEPQGIKHNEYEVGKCTVHRTGAITVS